MGDRFGPTEAFIRSQPVQRAAPETAANMIATAAVRRQA